MRRRALLNGGEIDYSKRYLTLSVISDGTIKWVAHNGVTKTISYSKDNGATWTEITSTAEGVVINVNAGDKVLLKGNNTQYATKGDYWSGFDGDATAFFDVEGNIMSLIGGDNFINTTTFSNVKFIFYRLFYQSKVVSAENLVLPVKTLRESCYRAMFSKATYLVKAPELPATTLANLGYHYMFENCSSLTQVQQTLPATTLTGKCYSYMFTGCSSLTRAPQIQATTLGEECCAFMFQNCTSLTVAPDLPATTLAARCYSNMFVGCTSLTTAPAILPATTLATYCYQTMFRNCINLTNAPLLPAETLVNYCYGYMFWGCVKINKIVCLAKDISATQCLIEWVKAVSARGTFYKASEMENWPRGMSGIPNNWTVETASS